MRANAQPTVARRAKGWLSALFDIAIAILVITLVKTAVAEPFYIPSGSMEPTLQIGDAILATKYSYGYGTASLPEALTLAPSDRILGRLPARGDVVVFRWPAQPSEVWVKRTIGLPGDRIAVREGQLWINGHPVGLRRDGTGMVEQEDGTRAPVPRYIETLPGGNSHPIFLASRFSPIENTGEIVVPPGHLFVMGDNRDNSADSRIPRSQGGVGLLPAENLVGKVETVVGSWDFLAANGPVWSWPAALRLSRFFVAVR